MNTAVGRLVRAELRLMTRDPLLISRELDALALITRGITNGDS